jgi:hypothetical protein
MLLNVYHSAIQGGGCTTHTQVVVGVSRTTPPPPYN